MDSYSMDPHPQQQSGRLTPPRVGGADYAPPIYRIPSASPRSRSRTTSSSTERQSTARNVVATSPAARASQMVDMSRPAMLRRSILESASAEGFSTAEHIPTRVQHTTPPMTMPMNSGAFTSAPLSTQQTMLPTSRQVPTTTPFGLLPSTATLHIPTTTTTTNMPSTSPAYNIIPTSPLYDGNEVLSSSTPQQESSSRSVSQHTDCVHCGCKGNRNERHRPRTNCRKNRHRSLAERANEPKKAPQRKDRSVRHRSRSGHNKTERLRRRSSSLTASRSLSSTAESRSGSKTTTTTSNGRCDVAGCGMRKKERSAGKKSKNQLGSITERGRPTSRRNRDSDSTRSSSASTSSSSSIEIPNRERPQRRGFSVASNSSINLQSTDGSSTVWDVDSKFMMAVRAGPTDCPDYILAKHPQFKEGEEPSPFQMYYFDETAPNEVLLANDVKGEHPMTLAKKQLKAFLNCQGGREEAFEVEGDDYLPEGMILPESESLSHRGRGLDEDEESNFYVQSYYTESAFTSVSAGAITRGQAREKQKQLEKNKPKTTDKKSAPCCGRGRKMSGPSTVEELSQPSTMRRESSAQPPLLVTARDSSNPRQFSAQRRQISYAGPMVSPNLLSPPQNVANTPYYSVRATTPPPPAMMMMGRPIQMMSKQAKPLPSIAGSVSGEYQKFNKVRQTNYVPYTPPATIAHRYGHPAYQAALAAEAVRQQHNAGLPAVWPQPGAPLAASPYDRSASSTENHQTELSSAAKISNQQFVVKSRGRTSRPRSHNRRGGTTNHRRRSESVSQSRHGHRSHRMRTRSVSHEEEPQRKVKSRGATNRFSTSSGAHDSSRPQSSRPHHGKVCPHCRGSGHVKGQDGRAALCGDCCIVKSNGKRSGLCCGGKQDNISLPSIHHNDSQSFSFRGRDINSYDDTYSEDELSSYRQRGPTIEAPSTDVVSFTPGDVALPFGYESDDGSVHKYKPSEKKEKNRDYGYHIRKNFFNASNLKVPEKGSECKMLPQYSVSYQNYPTVCYDVVVPTSNKDFYRVRKAPGFASV